MTKKGRNGRIEFFRFVFAMIVMIFHGKNVMNDGEIRIMFSGRLGVEFFFLVSGYLMAASIAKIAAREETPRIGRETEHFLVRKFLAVYPMVIIAYFTLMFVSYLSEPTSLGAWLLKIVKGASNLLLIQQSGIEFFTANGTWYISSMLFAMAILFPLGLKFHSFMRRVGFGLIALLVTGYMMMFTSGIGGPTTIIGDFTYRGNLRAISEIALGAVCFEGAAQLRQYRYTRLGQLLLGALEAAAYAISIWYMVVHEGSKYDYYILLLLAVGVTLTFSGCNYNSKFWDKQIFSFLGKASLYIYLGHITFARDLTFLIGEGVSNRMAMVIFIALGLSNAALLWAISEIIRRNMPKVRRLLIKET